MVTNELVVCTPHFPQKGALTFAPATGLSPHGSAYGAAFLALPPRKGSLQNSPRLPSSKQLLQAMQHPPGLTALIHLHHLKF
jgi:hypothetical protein